MKKTTPKIIFVITVFVFITTLNLYFIKNNLQLYFLILIPLTLLSVLIILFLFGWFKLDEKNLFNQPLFITSILLPLYYFLAFGLWTWKDQNILLSSSGFLNFYEISKLPLLILALSVPLASIINNIHRTIQTEKQIHESERKNNFDITINHMKHYTELFKKIESEELTEKYEYIQSIKEPTIKKEISFTPSIHYPNHLYKKLFISKDNNRTILFKTDEKFLKKIMYDWKHLNFCFKKLHKHAQTLRANKDNGNFRAVKCKIYFEMCAAYETLCNTLELGDFRPAISFGFEDKDDIFQIHIPFYHHITLYQSIKAIEKLSLKLFDIIRDENIDTYFPTNQRLFIYGNGAIDDWSYYLNNVVVMNELPTRITRSSSSFVNSHR
ncbi:TPA: hypothetical protein ACJIWW_003076 [Enterobacter asburiae]